MDDGIPKWSSKYETGVKAIDNDHKALFEEITALANALMRDDDEVGVVQAIDCLETYVSEHFRREESFMINAGYPETEAHIRSHRRLQRLVEYLRTLYGSYDGNIDPRKLSAFLSEWLSEHILKVDMGYLPYLKGEADDQDQETTEKLHDVTVQIPAHLKEVVSSFLDIMLSERPEAEELSNVIVEFDKRLREHELAEARKRFCVD